MVQNRQTLIDEFVQATGQAGVNARRGTVTHEVQHAPHSPHGLPAGKCAVYVFSLSESYRARCPAGLNRVLKVGKAGRKSDARFRSQHYNPHSAGSTLAGSLVDTRILWAYLAVSNMNDANVKLWITSSTDRDNFYLAAAEAFLLNELERYIKGRLGPVFEGG